MHRRDFIATLSSFVVTKPTTIDASWHASCRRFVQLSFGRIAWVELGRGPAALFLHGFPLNSYQWRGALERLHPYRRCIAPDLMSLGFSEPSPNQSITPDTQVEMLVAFLDRLRISSVDLIANDSGGLIAQLFLARHPHRVRTLLLTNCDVDTNNPPPKFVPAVDMARQGVFADRYIIPQLKDKTLARSQKGIGSAFTFPAQLTDETLDLYFAPIVSTPLRKSQFDQYTLALGATELPAIRENLLTWHGSARILWGLKDTFFPVQWADWLDHTFPNSHGVRRLLQANLFFPEEFPDVIAEELRALWHV